MNHRMHPRNIFQTPPKFKELALKYPDFRQYCCLSPSGDTKYNFKDPEALRILSYTLLKHYFSLDVLIPENTLIPTIPLRLNYVLWLQDLAEFLKISDDNIHVIDVGTGATCIYPLLMVKQRNWQVLALDKSEQSCITATKNVKRNNMENKIKVLHTQSNQIITEGLDSRVQYTFCMCNPPFYESPDDIEIENLENNSRPPPRNAPTGSKDELYTPGGEVAFIEQLINESKKLQDKILIYTTMIGHKRNIKPLKDILSKIEAKSFIETEFCQGVTTRWALAWTFKDTDLSIAPHQVAKKKVKKETKLNFMFENISINNLKTYIIEVLKVLKVKYQISYSNDELCELKISAKEDTWSNSRRKRRAAARLEKYKSHIDIVYNELKQLENIITDTNLKTTITELDKCNVDVDVLLNKLNNFKTSLNSAKKTLILKVDDVIKKLHEIEELKKIIDKNNQEGSSSNDNIDEPLAKRRKLNDVEKETSYLIEFSIYLLRSIDIGVMLTMIQTGGTGNANDLCSVYNYILNIIKTKYKINK